MNEPTQEQDPTQAKRCHYPDDPIKTLRKIVGARDAAPAKAGPIQPATFEDRQRQYKEDMERLHKAGYDYLGMEGWK